MMRRLVACRRGGIGLMAAAAMPVMIGAAALAVDLGSEMLETRQLQGAADAAALAAAGDPANADTLAHAALAAGAWRGAVDVSAVAGRYSADPSIAPVDRFASDDGAGANAARVTLTARAPSYFARIFGIHGVAIRRSATAAQINLASFSIGSRLAALNGGLVNALLGGLTGSTLSLDVMDYNALASANIDLFGFIDALRTNASISAGSYSNALDATVTTGQILQAAANVAETDGDLAASAALKLLAAQSISRSLKLGALIDPGILGGQDKAQPDAFRVNVMDLVTAAIETATPNRQVAIDLGGGIPGLAQTRLIVAIGERPENTPWLAVSNDGEPVIRTAQARIYAETTIGGAALPGLGGLVSIKLPLYVEMASAQARLKAIDCSSGDRGVSIDAKTGPATIAIGDVDTSRLQDFTSALPVNRATLVRALLVTVNGRADIDLGAAEDWQPLFFDQPQIAADTVQTVSSGTAVTGIAESLVRNLQLDVSGLPLGSLVNAVGAALLPVAPALDGLIDTVTGTLGVHYGQADVRVTGMRCGTPALVA